MSLFLASDLRIKARTEKLAKSMTSEGLLRETSDQKVSSIDAFLSHSKMDSELILGAKKAIEEYGLSVYVDWIDDPHLDRSKVCAATANQLRVRMSNARIMIYAHTENSSNSKWCPWELGFFDGIHTGNVFIMPIVDKERYHFADQEYLDLYPYLDKLGGSIFINQVEGGYRPLREALYKAFRKAP